METKPRIINGVCEFCGVKATNCIHNGNVPAEEAIAPEGAEENVGGGVMPTEEQALPTAPAYGLAAAPAPETPEAANPDLTPTEATPEPGMIDPNPTPVVPEGENFLKSDEEASNQEDIKVDSNPVPANSAEEKVIM